MNRRAALLFTCAAVLSVLLQTSVLPVYITAPFKPDLLLIISVYLALRSTFETGAPLAWLLGLLKDIFSGLYLGLNSFTFLIIFIVIKAIADRVYAESGFLFVLMVAVATMASIICDLLLLLMFTQPPGVVYSITSDLIPHLLTNTFVASLVALLPGFDRGQEAA
jgi:rod shape-determining protein MreD